MWGVGSAGPSSSIWPGQQVLFCLSEGDDPRLAPAHVRMDPHEATRTWAATWMAAWQVHEVEPIVALYAEDCVHRCTRFRPPHRGRQAVRDYVAQAFRDEQRIDEVRFGISVVEGDWAWVEYWARFLDAQGAPMTLVGSATARFDAAEALRRSHDCPLAAC